MAAVLSIRIAAILVFCASGFGKYIEGFPPGDGDAPLGQNEVREEHFQQTALFARLPRVEQVIRPVREFEDLDRGVDVLGARSGEPLDLVGGLRALGLPLGPLGVEEPVVDAPLQLVLVGRVDEAGDPLQAGLGGGDAGAGVDLDLAAAVAQGGHERLAHVLGQLERARGRHEHRRELGLGDELLRPAAVAAVVVDVLLLLDLGGDRAAAVPARHQPAEGEVVLAPPGVRVPVEASLHALEQLPRDERRVAAHVVLAPPVELARVERVAEGVVDHRRPDEPALLAAQAAGAGVLGEGLDGVGAPVVEVEEVADEECALGVDGEEAPPALADVQVPDGRHARVVPLLALLVHPLLHLLGEVVDVVLGHQHLDAVDELLRRPRLLGDDDPLLHEVDVDLHLVQRHPVLQVPVEAVGLLDEHDGGLVPLLLQHREHLRERRAPRLLGGLHVDELLDDGEAVVGRVLLEERLLRGDGEPLSLLLAAGHAGVEDGLPGGGGGDRQLGVVAAAGGGGAAVGRARHGGSEGGDPGWLT